MTSRSKRILGDMPKTVASRKVIAFGLCSSSDSAWHLSVPYRLIGSSGVSSVQYTAPDFVPYPLLLVGKMMRWPELRNRFRSCTASRFTVRA